MKIVTFTTIEAFLEANEQLLLKNESFNNLPLGLALSLRDKKFTSENPLFYSIQSGNEFSACALIFDNGRPLMLTSMPLEAINLVVQKLIDMKIELTAIIGDEVTAGIFKDQWNKINQTESKINTHLGVYECCKVIRPDPIAGKLINARPEHKEILKNYTKNFFKDFCPEDPECDDETIESIVSHHLDLGCIYILKNSDDEIVSMAAIIRSTTNTETIGFVYTPEKLRGKGYGSSIVALLAENILSKGINFVNLFTDLANKTSNSIYSKVGFVKIGNNIHYDFLNKSKD